MPQAQTCAHAAPMRAEQTMEPSMSREIPTSWSGAAPVPDRRNAIATDLLGRLWASHARLIGQLAQR